MYKYDPILLTWYGLYEAAKNNSLTAQRAILAAEQNGDSNPFDQAIIAGHSFTVQPTSNPTSIVRI